MEGASKVYGAYALAEATPIPDAPINISAVRANSTSIKVSLTVVTGATGYEIWRATSVDGPFSLMGSSNNASYTNKNIVPGTLYYYKVRTFKSVAGKTVYSEWSIVVNAAT